MLGESRRTTAIVAAIVVLVLLLFGIVAWRLVSERNAMREASIITGGETTVYVDPSQYPGWVPPQGADGGVDVPPAPESSSGSSGSGSFLPSLLGGSPKNLPAGYTERDLSAHYRKVDITNVHRLSNVNRNGDAPVVTIVGKSDAPVTLTGMRVKTNADEFVIPNAAKVYRAAGSVASAVTVTDGQKALVIGSASPVGASFMGNSCMGYLNSRYAFVPKLLASCKKPTKSEIASFSGGCQEYILRLGGCQEGNPNDSRIPAGDSACRNFVSTISYDGCVERNQGAANFSTNTWNIWAGRGLVDSLHDQVLLLDAGGKLVDWYVY